MTLTQQFLIVSILPLSFLGLAIYVWRSDVQRRPLRNRWIFTLVVTAVWASSVLRIYGGRSFSPALVYTWGTISWYIFSLSNFFLLLTTLAYFNVPRNRARMTIILSLTLLAITFGLDEAIWRYTIPSIPIINSITIRHFDIWSSVWVASWLMPVLASWLIVRQTQQNAPSSLYRNQARYWLLVLGIFIIGGLFVSIHQPDQPFWQQIGMLLILGASAIGSISIARGHMPDLRIATRHLLGRITGTLLVFGITWGFLSLIVWAISNRPIANLNLILILAAALFAGLFTLVYRFVNHWTTRLLLPDVSRQAIDLADYQNALAYVPETTQLGDIFIRNVQSTMMTKDVWLFLASDGPGGRLLLRPLTTSQEIILDPVDFAADSPFNLHLRQRPLPIMQIDIDQLTDFDPLSERERTILMQWQRVLYVPIQAGTRLIGMLALGAKETGDMYSRQEMETLQVMADQIGPFLVQTENIKRLHLLNNYAARDNQQLAREKQHFSELNQLYGLFIDLISPELRRPFPQIANHLRHLEAKSDSDNTLKQTTQDLSQQVKKVQASTEQLVTMASRIQKRGDFTFELVRLDDITLEAIRSLRTMADARRVDVNFEPDLALPTIMGDASQLQEAIRNLLHNAIKYNKIGGRVDLECVVEGNNLALHVNDIGVGISPQRMDTLWSGFSGLTRQNGHRGTGAGLGLPMTQFIIAAHGGKVTAKSSYGSGSTFSIYLPLLFEE